MKFYSRVALALAVLAGGAAPPSLAQTATLRARG